MKISVLSRWTWKIITMNLINTINTISKLKMTIPLYRTKLQTKTE